MNKELLNYALLNYEFLWAIFLLKNAAIRRSLYTILHPIILIKKTYHTFYSNGNIFEGICSTLGADSNAFQLCCHV